MLISQIKSILRNKSNRVYIFLFFIFFIILNFTLNIQDVIDKFFDTRINNNIVKDEDCDKAIKSIYIVDTIQFTEDEKNKIKEMQHIENIEVEYVEGQLFKGEKYIIIVDDWKNCTKIQKIFDKNGIRTGLVMGSMLYTKLIQNYESVKKLVELVKYIIIVMMFIIYIFIYKNIINNEKINFKILKANGYSNWMIRKIVFISLLTITAIGYFTGYILMSICANIFNFKEIISFSNLVVNSLIVILPVMMNTLKNKVY